MTLPYLWLFGFAEAVGESAGKAQQIIGADLIIFAQGNEVEGLHIVLAGFISGVYGLIDPQIFCNFFLGFVVVFPELAEPDLICLHDFNALPSLYSS